MHSGERWRLGHRPGLDGLRGVAILLVLACHTIERQWPNALGSAGVTVFFTLSGFLITALLLEEVDRAGVVSWAGFYRRRAVRLIPALAVMLAALGSLIVTAGLLRPSALVWVALYVANWSGVAGVDMSALSHMWSLAIEEQFYLVWPVVLIASRRLRHGPLTVAGFGIVVAVVLRFTLWDGGAGAVRVGRGSDTRMDALLIGCALAVLVTSGVRLRVPGSVVAAASAVALVAVVSAPESWSTNVLAPTVVPWVTALALVYALAEPGWLTGPVLRWFGRRSYGIYLWHYPMIYLTAVAPGNQAAIVAALLVSLAVAELSWRYVERPLMAQVTRKNSKYASTPPPEFSSLHPRPMNAGVNPGLNPVSTGSHALPSAEQ